MNKFLKKSGFSSLGACLFLAALICQPTKLKAKRLSLQIDISALRSIIKRKLPSSINLSGPLFARNFHLTKINRGIIYGTFDLVFHGEITVPTLFWSSKSITIKKSMGMQFKVTPKLKNYILYIPVQNVVISRSGVNLSLSNSILGGVVNVKRWLLSNKGKSLLKKKFKINFKPLLHSYFGALKWKIKIKLQNNKVILKANAP